MKSLYKSMCILLVALLSFTFAQYPDRPITYIISFDAGGESDITARLQQPHLEEILGASVTITNRPGGGGAVAWSDFQRSARPDGYSIIGINIPHIVTQPLERGDTGYETDNFTFLYWFQFTPNALLVRNDSPFQTLDELIEYAGEHPGSVTIGGSGSNTANHIGVLQLEQLADIDLTYVPFSGTGSAVPALLGGHVSALMSYTPVAVQYSDQVRSLAIASEERVSFLPDAPTFAEQEFDLVGGAYRGVAAPEGTPEDVAQTLTEAFEEVTQRIAEEQEAMGFVITYISGDEARQLVEEAKPEYGGVLEELR
jgi:tripartite-type tricarboxylate transporter receptor subunit TctC